ncbi:SET and MYND domain-containing protein 4-like [Toxorhynchites rutilus septentrionalis]|uniref:SET and MYND domain-containing protein 4-like n=1 Tax=Toxorhynchites rutilus septentrionalis TaxID=329112 RepID=UPI0024791513|nr:SET and MYND domain-containing protein 4-like [Toxorhynchites rutilus septentrionalis]
MADFYASKSNIKSRDLRKAGNRLFACKDYAMALTVFNESVCWAETGSEDLAIAYANRSAVYYQSAEYEFALKNISLAKNHYYPKRFMPKLVARELNCKAKMESASLEKPAGTTLLMNVEANPKIPFLAKGICMKRIAGYGRSMIAEREFDVGDIILHEKAAVTMLTCNQRYTHCNYCGDWSHSLIPCPGCVSAMYCGEKCLENDIKLIHRFECGIIADVAANSIGPKMFFYGFALFGDNVSTMMEFCNTRSNTTATADDPLCLDYTNYDPLEEFKLIHNFFSIASICNHSCNPNTAALYNDSGHLKFDARRPIAKNEQIFISYGIDFMHVVVPGYNPGTD